MRIQKAISSLLELILLACIIPVLLIGGYVVYDAISVRESASIAVDLVEMAENDDGALFERLSLESSAVVGWLKINDTGINYPVVQGENNSFYLARNYKGEYATAGSAFLDYRNAADFSDSFSVIYGHRMGYGKMFSDVTKFVQKDYFESHYDGKLLLRSGKHNLRIAVFAIIKADEEYVYDISAIQDGRAIDYLNSVALYSREALPGDKYIMLSTCDANDKSLRDVLLIQVL